ncbi:MAG: AmmeMemoRadiSam system protein B [bacterium]
MKRAFLLFLCFTGVFLGCAAKNGKKIKKPEFAGSWYPSGRVEIENFISRYLEKAVSEKIHGRIIGMIFPHPGWIYSAPVTAENIRQLTARNYSTAVLLGSSHHSGFRGAHIADYDEWETPLGNVPLNKKFAAQIAGLEMVSYNNTSHRKEHCLEIVLPSLRYALKNFSIVPVIMGQDWETYRFLSKNMAALYGEDILFIASSDMSHYFTYDEANDMDKKCLSYLENFDVTGLRNALRDKEVQLCGAQAVLTVMEASRLAGANAVKVLKYANSGDTTGDKSRVVGYCAVCFYKKGVEMLNEEEKKELIQIAKKTIAAYIKKGKAPEFNVMTERLKEVQGAFVTLHIGERLRGCIGNIVGVKPLWETVRDMAVEASTRDPRFPPVSKDELSQIKIEISALTPPKKVLPDEIVMGRDGVIVKKGFRQGVYLPQVATETGWSKEEFLSSLCQHKAGLEPDAWTQPDTEIFVFQADVFSE